ncbi:GNAT family N-acetyltransferase [Halovenus marina]|uniref:GNAT family N-acetyltransferase n=1 Tax=Halovenus marina TaxID=3396621 RepID=UPI003F570EB4
MVACSDVEVREARADEHPDVRNVIDGAMLQVGVENLPATIDAGDVLVAVDGTRIVGALVLDGRRIAAVAVRRRRRGQGIGSALVAAAKNRRCQLSVSFDADRRPFWTQCGFEVTGTFDSSRFVARWRGR